MSIYKKRFVWVPEYVDNGVVADFGWRWLVFGWYVWYEGRYENFWLPITHDFSKVEGYH